MRIGRLRVEIMPAAECDCCGGPIMRRRNIVAMLNEGGVERDACRPCAALGGCGLNWVRA